MRFRLRHFLTALAVLLTAACADSPTAPSIAPDGVGPSKIGVWAPGGGGKCDPWMNLDWCEPDDGGGCMTSQPPEGTPEEFQGVQGCLPPGGGGGGGTTPTDTVPTDTCKTGDPVLDSPAVKQGLNDLWARSNPTAPQAQRLEQAGWIVQRSDGSFYMAPFTISAQGPCSVNGNLNAPPGAVAFVHTHPFTQGEVQTICGAIKQPDPFAPGGFRDVIGSDGRPVHPVYDNKPSIPDRNLMNDVNRTRARFQPGSAQLSGVIIDANQTTVYTENTADGNTPFPRCGY